MMLKEKLSRYFAENREQIIADISALVAIQSDRQAPLPGKPYGEGPAACLEKALEIAAGMGFAVKNYDNYVGAVDFSDAEKGLDILAHLDVVPVGDGWTVTEP
ncbi:MAG: peptidase M20, partial [Oscillospiraceae bacterium]|nr:peptidase M20 [Oscillospiraceae bacterium]